MFQRDSDQKSRKPTGLQRCIKKISYLISFFERIHLTKEYNTFKL